ncbi:unnamed protein product [Rotaria magnacalcarata]|uniref:Uncharacterized protein n=1 Tax=Rotaria magnacalcarata TaxID=392030 RepID=A0A8S2LVY2_9BILA|nr:unnamed protein product [Rotaria magnacalcarata]
MDKRNQSLSLKRHRTNGSEYQCDDNINLVDRGRRRLHFEKNRRRRRRRLSRTASPLLVDNDNENSYRQRKNSKYKRRNNYSRNDQPLTTNSRTYTNSNSNITDNRNFQQRKSQKNDINDSNNKHYDNRENPFHISYQALAYAAATYLQPIKLECVPKMNDQKEAAKFIQHFFKFIKNNFDQQSNYHDRPAGFDQWWIGKEDNIQGTTKLIDLYVFLYQHRYPAEINNIKHLPPQRSVVLKWIKTQFHAMNSKKN